MTEVVQSLDEMLRQIYPFAEWHKQMHEIEYINK
jgi:hypothetical protein